jgi:hypothetical protein
VERTTEVELTARLDRVERDIRMLKWLWLLLALGLALTQRFPVTARYSAQSYVLHNQDGQTVGSFGLDRNGLPACQLLDPTQDVAIELAITPEHSSSVTLTGWRSETSLSAGDTPTIRLSGPNKPPWSAP